ncbi:hypothetical protein GPK51_08550 [Eubacterium ventriosum]|nr:hypothetical protein [Eubacterium ventriosum]
MIWKCWLSCQFFNTCSKYKIGSLN